MYKFLAACRPVLFEHSDSDYPYWGRGSAVLVSGATYCFCVTATHVFLNQEASIEQLRIFPSDMSKNSIPYDERVTIKPDRNGSAVFEDLVMYRVAMSECERKGDAPLVSYDVETECFPAHELKKGESLFFAGFPSEARHVDYDAARIHSTIILRNATFLGASSLGDHAYEILAEERHGLGDFDGLSGGPVYYPSISIVDGVPRSNVLFAGLILQGTASSRRIHFIDSGVVRRMVKLAHSL